MMSALLWALGFWLFLELLAIVAAAAKRKTIVYTPAVAVVCTVSYGFFIVVAILAATKGVAP